MAPRTRVRDQVNGLRVIARIRVRDAANVLRTLQQVRVRDAGNVLRTVWAAFSAAASAASVSGYSNTGASATIATNTVTVTPAGGAAPYTHAWTQVGASGYTWTISSAGTDTTSFSAAAVPPGIAASANFQDTVTDANGLQVVVPVTAYANNGQPYDPAAKYDTNIRSTQ